MDVLFSIIPGHGHFFPCLPLARALSEAGHSVRFASSATYAETISDHGFEPLPVGPDYTQGSLAATTEPGERDRVIAEMMFEESPPQVIDDLLAALAGSRPDVMLVDPYELGGQVVAEVVDVPFGAPYAGIRRVGSYPGSWSFDHAERLKEQASLGVRARLFALRSDQGLEEPDLLPGEMPFDRRLSLCMAPPSLEAWPLPWVLHTAHPLRPEAHAADSDDGWLHDLPRDRPIVAVTFGTLFGTAQLETEAAVAALESGARVVVVSRHELGVDDPRVHTVSWISLPRLLELADAVIHHGGWGSTVAALTAAVPAVVVPQGADQKIQGARLASVGAAVVLLDSEDRPAQLRGAVQAVLEHGVYAANAARMAQEIAAMPSAAEVVPLVEELAETGGPVLSR